MPTARLPTPPPSWEPPWSATDGAPGPSTNNESPWRLPDPGDGSPDPNALRRRRSLPCRPVPRAAKAPRVIRAGVQGPAARAPLRLGPWRGERRSTGHRGCIANRRLNAGSSLRPRRDSCRKDGPRGQRAAVAWHGTGQRCCRRSAQHAEPYSCSSRPPNLCRGQQELRRLDCAMAAGRLNVFRKSCPRHYVGCFMRRRRVWSFGKTKSLLGRESADVEV